MRGQSLRWLCAASALFLALLCRAEDGPRSIPSAYPSVAEPKECLAEDCLPIGENTSLTVKAASDLIKWLNANGATISDKLGWPKEYPSRIRNNPRKHIGVELKGLPNEEEEEVLAMIPRNLALVASEEIKLKYGTVVRNLPKLLDADDIPISRLRAKDIFLTLMVIEEKKKGEASFFSPYIATLPPLREVFMVEVFKEDELAVFQDPSIEKYKKFYLTRVQKVYEELVRSKLLDSTVPLSEFQWAYYNVRRRSKPWLLEGSEKQAGESTGQTNETVALVPFLDLFRLTDDTSYNMAWDLREDGVFVTGQGATSLGEATVYHGPHSNFFILMNYGMVPEDNVEEGYAINLRQFVGDEKLRLVKETKWNATNPQTVKYVIALNRERPPLRLLAFFRLLVVPSVELVASLPLETPSYPPMEDVALSACSRRIVQELEVQKTTYEADEEDLARTDYTVWTELQALGFHYRMVRKRILQSNKCYCDRLRSEHAKFLPKDPEADPAVPLEYLDSYTKMSEAVFDQCFLR